MIKETIDKYGINVAKIAKIQNITQSEVVDDVNDLYYQLTKTKACKGKSMKILMKRTKGALSTYYAKKTINKAYDWLDGRRLFNQEKNLAQESLIQCPICLKIGYVSEADLHHLLPKSLGEHLWYDVKNLVYLCKQCHRKIHTFMEH